LDGQGGIAWLACGIGVNLAVTPALPDRPTTSLAVATGTAPEPVAFAWRLLAAVTHWQGQGLPAVREAWLARGPALDTPLELRQGGRPRHGRFAGLDQDGRLLLATPEGLLPVAAGEVVG
jgi:BirA family biotin operon repressor/biotin-[acetyl-CoA-carboxylase] ligase